MNLHTVRASVFSLLMILALSLSAQQPVMKPQVVNVVSTPQNSHPEIKINSLYPNPTIDFLQIQGAQGKNCGSDCLTFEVIDLNGYVRLRTTIDLSTGADEVNLSDLDEQFYVIRIFSADRDFFFEDRIQKIRE